MEEVTEGDKASMVQPAYCNVRGAVAAGHVLETGMTWAVEVREAWKERRRGPHTPRGKKNIDGQHDKETETWEIVEKEYAKKREKNT